MNALKAIRLRQGMTAVYVAAKVAVSLKHLYSIENGTGAPSCSLAKRLATFYKVSIDEILGFTTPTTDIALFYKDFGVITKLSKSKQEEVKCYIRKLERQQYI